MKKNIILLLTLFTLSIGYSQILEPVKWSTDVKKISNSEYELIVIAKIQEKWHLYSQFVTEGGPVATQFTFEGNNKYLKKGNTKEEAGLEVHDTTFDMDVTYFEKETTFKQRIKLKSKVPFTIKAEVNYMVCDDAKCIMPDPAVLVFDLK